MAKVGVKRATELTGKSKSTIQRAMNDGKLSYEMDGKTRIIDVSELERVYGIQDGAMTSGSDAKAEVPSYETELQKAKHALEVDRLEMKVKMLEDQLDAAEDQINDLKAQRDQWQKQAQQVLLTSQNSQKQSDDRIAEMQRREEARAKALQAKRQQDMQRQKAIAASNQNAQSNSLFSALFTKKKKAS
jgi:chromosome segregation ATPase